MDFTGHFSSKNINSIQKYINNSEPLMANLFKERYVL